MAVNSSSQGTQVSIRLDSDIKPKFELLCRKIGMSMSTAMNVFARQSVLEQKIPFEISARQEFFNDRTMSAIREAEALSYDDSAETFDSVDDLMKDLLS